MVRNLWLVCLQQELGRYFNCKVIGANSDFEDIFLWGALKLCVGIFMNLFVYLKF